MISTDTYCLYNGNSLDVLKLLPSESVQCIVTGPPYYGLRDYGHKNQIGLEDTPEEYIHNLVVLFREARRVLKNDGTLWINLGDSYAWKHDWKIDGGHRKSRLNPGRKISSLNIKAKDLMGIPWRVAFALQDDGWYLRQDIIWHKTNAAPQSVEDRCTTAHEYIFLLSKAPVYYYDYKAIREPNAGKMPYGNKYRYKMNDDSAQGRHGSTSIYAGGSKEDYIQKYYTNGRNKRSVWSVPTKPYLGAHFATMPIDLIEPCILAGTKPGDTILDPFNGSGTTGVAAIRNDRKYVGIELNPDYIQLAIKRLSELK